MTLCVVLAGAGVLTVGPNAEEKAVVYEKNERPFRLARGRLGIA